MQQAAVFLHGSEVKMSIRKVRKEKPLQPAFNKVY